MPTSVHTVERPDGDGSSLPDRSILGHQFGVPNASGGASTAITTAIVWASPLPPSYFVDVEVAVAGVWVSITGKTANGFNVVLTPLTGASVAAGTFNVRVTA